jgi:hypothetical protein
LLASAKFENPVVDVNVGVTDSTGNGLQQHFRALGLRRF